MLSQKFLSRVFAICYLSNLLCIVPSLGATVCTPDAIPQCSSAEVSGAFCLCVSCVDGHVLNTARTQCLAEVTIECGGVATDARHVCGANSYLVGGVCQCEARFVCSDGVCKDTRCAGRLPTCEVYLSEYEDPSGDCPCISCSPPRLAGDGLCYLPKSCDRTAHHRVQCPSHSTLSAASLCTCLETHICNTTSGGCTPKEVVSCGNPVDTMKQRCLSGATPVDGGCQCDGGMKCADGVCSYTFMKCGDELTMPYHQCASFLKRKVVDGKAICVCSDDYKDCTNDHEGCKLARCGGDILTGCELYYDTPVDGICRCRRCDVSLILRDHICVVNNETPAPETARPEKVSVFALLHTLTGPDSVKGLTMLKAGLMSLRTASTEEFVISRSVVYDIYGQDMRALVLRMLKMDVYAVMGCETQACATELFALLQELAPHINFFTAAPLQVPICHKRFFATAPTPHQIISSLVTFGAAHHLNFYILRSSHRYISKRAQDMIALLGANLVGESVITATGALKSEMPLIFARVTEGTNFLNLLDSTFQEEFFKGYQQWKPAQGYYQVLSYAADAYDVKKVGAEVMAGSVVASHFVADEVRRGTMTDKVSVDFVNSFASVDAPAYGFAVANNDYAAIEHASGLEPTEDAVAAYLAAQIAVWRIKHGTELHHKTVSDMALVELVYFNTPGQKAKLHVSYSTKRHMRLARLTASGEFEVLALTPLLVPEEDPSSSECFNPEVDTLIPCDPCPEGYVCGKIVRCVHAFRQCGERLTSYKDRCADSRSTPDADGVCQCEPGYDCSSEGCVVKREFGWQAFKASLVLANIYWSSFPDNLSGSMKEVVDNTRRNIATVLGLPMENIRPTELCPVLGDHINKPHCFPGELLMDDNSTIEGASISEHETPLPHNTPLEKAMYDMEAKVEMGFDIEVGHTGKADSAYFVAKAFAEHFREGVQVANTPGIITHSSTYVRSDRAPLNFQFESRSLGFEEH